MVSLCFDFYVVFRYLCCVVCCRSVLLVVYHDTPSLMLTLHLTATLLPIRRRCRRVFSEQIELDIMAHRPERAWDYDGFKVVMDDDKDKMPGPDGKSFASMGIVKYVRPSEKSNRSDAAYKLPLEPPFPIYSRKKVILTMQGLGRLAQGVHNAIP